VHPARRYDHVLHCLAGEKPHVATKTIEDRMLMARIASGNLLAGLKGEVPRFILNPDVLKDRKN
jgi:hypothetical protein